MTLDKNSWGLRRDARLNSYITVDEPITAVVETVSWTGNTLINVGPTREGTMPAICEELLLELGK